MKDGPPDKFRIPAFSFPCCSAIFPPTDKILHFFVGFLNRKVYICILKNNFKNF